MESTTAPNIIERLTTRAQRLYSLPAVAMKVVELTGQPQVDAAALRDWWRSPGTEGLSE